MNSQIFNLGLLILIHLCIITVIKYFIFIKLIVPNAKYHLKHTIDYINHKQNEGLVSKIANKLISTYIDNEDEKIKKNNKKILAKFIIILILLLITMVFYILVFKGDNEFDIMELSLGNIIPITIVTIFEIWFIDNILLKWKMFSQKTIIPELVYYSMSY